MNKAPSITVARGLGLLAWLVCGEAMAEDCNHNGQQDVADIAACISLDMNGNGIPDECDIAEGRIPDCNENGIADWVDIYAQEDPCGNMIGGASQDCNTDGIPDECQLHRAFGQKVHNRKTLGKRSRIANDLSAVGPYRSRRRTAPVISITVEGQSSKG